MDATSPAAAGLVVCGGPPTQVVAWAEIQRTDIVYRGTDDRAGIPGARAATRGPAHRGWPPGGREWLHPAAAAPGARPPWHAAEHGGAWLVVQKARVAPGAGRLRPAHQLRTGARRRGRGAHAFRRHQQGHQRLRAAAGVAIAAAPQPAPETETFEELVIRRPAPPPAPTEPEPEPYVELPELAADEAAIEQALAALEQEYPRILPRLLALDRGVQPGARAATLQLAGQRVGAWVFAREYSLDTGLALDAALSAL